MLMIGLSTVIAKRPLSSLLRGYYFFKDSVQGLGILWLMDSVLEFQACGAGFRGLGFRVWGQGTLPV